MSPRPTRRRVLENALFGAAPALVGARAAAATGRRLDGGRLYADVVAYDAMGDHRTGAPADEACSRWLRRRLQRVGFRADLQPFPAQRFAPGVCRLEAAGAVVEVLPAWPVRPTPAGGLAAPLSSARAGRLDGRIALVRLPYGLDASWAIARLHDPVVDAIARGAAAVLAVTEGPTGGVIALNAVPGRFDWPVPVALVGPVAAAPLQAAADTGAAARLTLDGVFDPQATATNVVARRRGEGRTLVVSTPKSGWFRCAGERGGGIAVCLALAEALAATTRRDLLFIATSGHELGEAGGADFLRTAAPAPTEVALWLHVGANVALQEVEITRPSMSLEAHVDGSGVARRARSITVSETLAEAAGRAFAGVAGYETPKVFTAAAALGELEMFRRAGYAGALAGMLGSSPLFHTRADRAAVATTPQVLLPVAEGALRFATLAG